MIEVKDTTMGPSEALISDSPQIAPHITPAVAFGQLPSSGSSLQRVPDIFIHRIRPYIHDPFSCVWLNFLPFRYISRFTPRNTFLNLPSHNHPLVDRKWMVDVIGLRMHRLVCHAFLLARHQKYVNSSMRGLSILTLSASLPPHTSCYSPRRCHHSHALCLLKSAVLHSRDGYHQVMSSRRYWNSTGQNPSSNPPTTAAHQSP